MAWLIREMAESAASQHWVASRTVGGEGQN
jgi:hypothetical protein